MIKPAMILRRLEMIRAVGVRLKIGDRSHFNRLGLRMRKGDSVTIGDDSIVDASLRTDRSPASIAIGSRTFISGGSMLVAADRIEVGDDVLISWGVTIVDHDSHSLDFDERAGDVLAWGQGIKDWQYVAVKPVKVCDKAWIGFGVSILKGVVVGEGAVIGAKSVVTRDVEPWTVVAGNPARVLRKLPQK